MFLILLAFCQAAFAYDFPYNDPYTASITSAILKFDLKDKSIEYQDLKLKSLPARDSVPFYGASRNKITMRLWAQKEKAPLIVMVAGLGGSAAASYNNFLAAHFYKRGFHVLAFPSPFHFSFALSASTSGLPGVTRADSADLYRVLDEGVTAVEKKIKISQLGLIGVSMGALEAAYLAEIDQQKGLMNFERILLVNPPVNPLRSMETLTKLAAEPLGDKEKSKLQEKVYYFGIQSLAIDPLSSPDYFLHLDEKLPTTERERKYLVGTSLQDFLQALIFTTQQIDDLGVLPGPPATDNPSDRLKASKNFTFQDYQSKFLLPGLSKRAGKPVTIEDLEGDIGMDGVEYHLRKDQRVYLMHNEDDFILNEGELAYLRDVFGDRARLFPRGGHVGNIWFKENLDAIMETFEAIK